MSSREDILRLIDNNKPDFISLSLQTIESEIRNYELLEIFANTMSNIGGSVQIINDLSVVKIELFEKASNGKRVLNRVEEIDYPIDILPDEEDAVFYEDVFVACLKGTAGVAENGAIWVEEESMGNRLVPFICQHLILVLYRNTIVCNMHEVYKQIDTSGTKYGVFIAGPSKTADIEQSLVIGAHGARSLKVFIVDK